MNKTPMKSFEIIKEMYEYFVKHYRDLEPKLMICEKEDFDIIETALNDNYFYKHIISKICGYMGLDITVHRDLVETENEILNTLVEYENKLKRNIELEKEHKELERKYYIETLSIDNKKLKALEIIKEKEMLSTYKDYKGVCYLLFNTTAIEISQEEYDLLKEVLL